ncbi:MFS transporter [Streptomyces albireticuli]|uniref:MFS transporter n=1 Tax=Streptomyces albireticuli TaxID=1940 RepID=A0A2A2D116_9ACTN|nr:MFS transporter [Streptomyces albireticuli]MCD9143617.1 MFS transporter [Streptomyces albireticuli]MCD9161952.1 MFS transporter [Streptomyces albireticuli]MCD9191734.1 MFS transporter [Streptomyces albireticuli]PAU45109.1 MFS transporter [Streptomyces albireticuli]
MTATTADTSGATAEIPPRRNPTRWVILGVICLAQLTVLLDNTVLNVAIPSLTADLGASTSDVQWMLNAYSLVQAGLLLTAGNAADRYGRKKMLMAGLALFGVGSFAAGLSESTGQLIAARAGMGVGGALLMTTTLAVIMQVFDADERAKAIGLWGAVSSLGFAAGPLVGGTLLNHFWWGAIFLVNLPVAALGLLAVARLVPESKNPSGDRPDLLGALLSTVGMAGVTFAIISGPEHGWTSARVLASAGVGLVVLAAFALWEQRIPHPMLDMHFFRDSRFVGAVSGSVLVAFGMGGSLFLLAQHLQLVLGYDPLETGLRMSPLALMIVLLNLTGVGARLLPKVGTPASIAGGMTLLAAGLAAVAVLGADGYGGMLLGLVLMGSGIALSMPAMATAIMSAIPPEKAGVGAGVNGTLQESGNGLGVAVLGAVLNSRFAALVPAAAVGAGSLPEALSRARTDADRSAIADAFASGVQASQLVGAGAVLVGGVLAAVLLWRAERKVVRG